MRPHLVQFAARIWTLQAMHLACAMARDESASVVLLRLVGVEHFAWLGTELGDIPPTEPQHKLLDECQSIAALYNVPLSLQSMQYHSLIDALAQAATLIDSQSVFAQLPESKLSFLNRMRRWNLKRQLGTQRRELYTLEQPDEPAWTPAIMVKATK